MKNHVFDVIIVGSGVSGGNWAKLLTQDGKRVLLLEAGDFFQAHSFPRTERVANSKLYWSGGIEFNKSVSLGLLRPKVVGGGSIVNQALLDKFDDNAWDSFRDQAEIPFLNSNDMDHWYEKAMAGLCFQTIPEEERNGNGALFQKGFKSLGYDCAPLTRAQSNCKYREGNDCIECLAGCPLNSKQSSLITGIKPALKAGLKIYSRFNVKKIDHSSELIKVWGNRRGGSAECFTSKQLVLAAGSIGNSKLLINSGFHKKLPAIGKNFYTHPQFMVLGIFKDQVNAHKGPLQSYKSDDLRFREMGFKLENVFAPPVAISMLLPGFGKSTMSTMEKYTHMGCIEVAIRDTTPGNIRVSNKGKVIVNKDLGVEDQMRKKNGLQMIFDIMNDQGVEKIIPGDMGIGLHLMGGLSLGENPKTSVVNEKFQLHSDSRIYCADSSVFPNAPGINPSLSIMALTHKAAASFLEQVL